MATLFGVCALMGIALFLFGFSLWFLYEALGMKSMPLLCCVPPTVYSSIALGAIPVIALGITPDRPEALVRGIRTVTMISRVICVCSLYLLAVDSFRFARAHMRDETLFDDINKEIRNPIVLVQWLFGFSFGTVAQGERETDHGLVHI